MLRKFTPVNRGLNEKFPSSLRTIASIVRRFIGGDISAHTSEMSLESPRNARGSTMCSDLQYSCRTLGILLDSAVGESLKSER